VSQHQLDRSEGQKQARWDAGTPVSAKKANQNVGPRLVGGTTFGKNDGIDKAQVVLLANASLESLEESRKVIVGWQRQGLTLSQIYLNGIAESAKVLGDHWLSDKLSFVDCTIGFSRLHQMLHDYSAAIAPSVFLGSTKCCTITVPSLSRKVGWNSMGTASCS